MHKKTWNKKDDNGEAGISKITVFIAMVLAAAVSGSLLMDIVHQIWSG